MRQKFYANKKNIDLASYYLGLNLPNTIALMRKTTFPKTVPVIDMVSEINFPDSVSAARWRACHRQFVEAQPNRQGITAYRCGHFIFRDNPLLAIGAIVKAYTGVVGREQGYEIMRRYLSYSLDAANEEKKRAVHQ